MKRIYLLITLLLILTSTFVYALQINLPADKWGEGQTITIDSLIGIPVLPTVPEGKYLKDDGTFALPTASAAWGNITGTLSAQTDLNSAIAGKEPANVNIQNHIISIHAPSNAQKNSDITKAEIEAKLTGELTTHTHTGGANPFTSILILGADKPTGANTTPVTLGLSFTYEANKTYVIDIFALIAPTAATTGCGFMIDVDSAVTYVGTFVSHQLAATGTLSGAASIGDKAATSSGVSSGMVSTASQFVYGGGMLITTENTGTATFFFRSETTAVTTCKAGTVIRVQKIN